MKRTTIALVMGLAAFALQAQAQPGKLLRGRVRALSQEAQNNSKDEEHLNSLTEVDEETGEHGRP
jgi:hypothetical protein